MKKALKVIAWTLLSVVLTVMVVISIACYLTEKSQMIYSNTSIFDG